MAGKARWGRRVVLIVVAILVVLVGYIAVAIIGSRSQAPQASLTTPVAMAGLPNALPATITLTTWNLGFAALGAEGDAISDGGTHLFPESAEFVQKNVDGIVATLGSIESDMFMLQEVSQRSLMSWWRPLYASIVNAMPDRQIAYRPDVHTWGLVYPLAIDHGTVVALDANPRNIEIVPLPLEPEPIMGLIKRLYSLQVVRVPIDGQSSDWVLINLHLSAYDEAGNVRKQQLDRAMDFAEAEFKKGNHVVMGGDWNMVLHDPKLAYTTPESLLGWVVMFPPEALPPGWKIVAGDGPTVRSTDHAYAEGENYRTGIDGFVVSPNVTAGAVTIHDNAYAYSDHMPVTASFTAN